MTAVLTTPSPRIHLLSSRLANQIAAGEVVDRPASVIKELLENALDAGATRIEIDIEGGGCRRMCVRDNGSGIHPADLALALTRHATSKIANVDDLAAVASLGFRGEALASIASVARLTLTSRLREPGTGLEDTAAEQTAWSAFAEGADMQVRVQPAAAPSGTTVEVSDLFFNTPARRRFLRADSTEFAHIDDVVKRVALAQPQCAFALRHDQKSIRHWRAELPAERMRSVMGRGFAHSAHAFDQHIDAVRIHGWIGALTDHRSSADAQYVYVNGRGIRDRVVNHALRAGYDQQLAVGRAPAYCVFIEMPAAEVDVNVHPTKHEVRFRQARWMHDWLSQIVRQALRPGLEQHESGQQESTLHELGPLAPRSVAAKPEPVFPAPLALARPETTASYRSEPWLPARPPVQARVHDVWGLYRTDAGALPAAAVDLNAEVAPEPLPVAIASSASTSAADMVGATNIGTAGPAALWRAAGFFWWHSDTGLLLAPEPELLAAWWRDALPAASLKPLMFPVRLALTEPAAAICAGLHLDVEQRPESLRILAAPAPLAGCDWPVLLNELLAEAGTSAEPNGELGIEALLLKVVRHWLARPTVGTATQPTSQPTSATSGTAIQNTGGTATDWLNDLRAYLTQTPTLPVCLKPVSGAALLRLWSGL